MQHRNILVIVLLLAVLFGCTTEAERRQMRAGLDSINVLNRTDQPFTPDDVRPYVDFFDKEAKAFFTLLPSDSIHNDQLLAHYLLGRAYHEKGDAPMALESYQHAIDHADTTSASCDYYTLMATYGQMSILFHQQNLPHVIVNMSETSSAALSTAKSRANLKLFGKKDAHSLKINLLRAIKHA